MRLATFTEAAAFIVKPPTLYCLYRYENILQKVTNLCKEVCINNLLFAL